MFWRRIYLTVSKLKNTLFVRIPHTTPYPEVSYIIIHQTTRNKVRDYNSKRWDNQITSGSVMFVWNLRAFFWHTRYGTTTKLMLFVGAHWEKSILKKLAPHYTSFPFNQPPQTQFKTSNILALAKIDIGTRGELCRTICPFPKYKIFKPLPPIPKEHTHRNPDSHTLKHTYTETPTHKHTHTHAHTRTHTHEPHSHEGTFFIWKCL